MDSDPDRLPFWDADEEKEPAKPIPPLPDIDGLVTRIKRQADKAKTFEGKVGFIDIGVEELKQIKAEGWRQYQELVDEHNLDDPDPFWRYDTDLDRAIKELSVLRQRMIVEESERSAPARVENERKPMPMSTNAEESPAPPATPPASPPEIMNVSQLASYFEMSEEWVYRNYEPAEIPYGKLGTELRFRKDEIDLWWKTNQEAMQKKKRGKRKVACEPTHQAPISNNSQASPSAPPHESPDIGIHPKITSRIDQLVSLLYEKGYLAQGESLRFKNWMLNGARRDPGDTKIAWLKQRKSLVTCIILSHYAELVGISEAKGKEPPRPDFGATIERDFIAEDKPMLQNIDRDFAKDIDREVKSFIEYIRSYAKRNDLDFPLDNSLAAALAEYYDDIDGSEGLAVEAKEIKANGKDLDFQMMKLFHSLSSS